ncbi:hypothetical protein EBAPG3_011075 [Nitrosospira lacus]|uniref:Uncharacterized protein n=1 Tax=Nitrosospira lacus TaxID=1288494 RepID=A0A1W6SR48_9PROT|nr:hypothetical protein EBAPG3_011075 [Nitrosospira lacus]
MISRKILTWHLLMGKESIMNSVIPGLMRNPVRTCNGIHRTLLDTERHRYDVCTIYPDPWYPTKYPEKISQQPSAKRMLISLDFQKCPYIN